MRILAVGAHPDDVELGAGGTLARHAAAGDQVYIVTLAAGPMSRGGGKAELQKYRGQAIAAATVLGARVATLSFADQRFDRVDRLVLVQAIEAAIHSTNPERVYTHHRGDRNLDHRITHDAVMTACRPVPGAVVRSVFAFEVQSSTEWGDEPFCPSVFVDVTGDPLSKKLEALACYEGEMARAFPHPRSVEAIAALARWRGATAGIEAAEAFVLLREIR